jgi:hypothetical protein
MIGGRTPAVQNILKSLQEQIAMLEREYAACIK